MYPEFNTMCTSVEDFTLGQVSHSNLLLHCVDELQQRQNSCSQLHLNFRFGLYHVTVVLRFLRSNQPCLQYCEQWSANVPS